MHIYDPSRERFEERRLDHAHVPGQYNQTDFGRSQPFHDLPFQLWFQLRLIPARPDKFRRYPVLPGTPQNRRILTVTDHEHDSTGNFPPITRIENSFAIGAGARTEYPDAQIAAAHASFLIN